ncbi:MAG: hypothetical protein J6R47_02850 [Acholeplasmatales bacterium]|nr:hypothetical protein [Acholeplasmatales bacterium]
MVSISYFIIIGFIILVLLYGAFKKVKIYDAFIDGVKESLKTGIMIIPYILTMYVAVSVFKNSNILNDLIKLNKIPSEIFIQGIFRPISSHASLAMFISNVKEFGADSKVALVSSILQGGNDTTIYVMGLYFGYANIKKTRHAYTVGIICDVICFILCILLLLFV